MIGRLLARALSAAALLCGATSAHAEPQVSFGALGGRFVRLADARIAPSALPRNTRLVVLYFGASWCGPCRAFVPELKSAYPQLRARGAEVVFVSDDATCAAAEDYMRQARMPWLGLPCHGRAHAGRLQAKRGAALPGLLVYDRSGRLLVTSWTRLGASHPRAALNQLLALAAR